MLTNHNSMALERIHNMLRLATSGNETSFRFDMNLVQFKKYMQTLCDSEKLEMVEGGSYRVLKK